MSLMDGEPIRKLESELRQILGKFQQAKDWTDVNTGLNGILRVVQKLPCSVKSLNCQDILSKRLAQSLNSNLPAGVHIKCLEIYNEIFKSMSLDEMAVDVGVWAPGLFPIFQYSASVVQGPFITLINQHFIPLKERLTPCLTGLLVALLPGLENVGLPRYIELLQLFKVIGESCVGLRTLMVALWSVLVRMPTIRVAGLNLLESLFPDPPPHDEKTNNEISLVFLPDFSELVVRAYEHILLDPNLFVTRAMYDFIIKHTPLSSTIYSPVDKYRLINACLHGLRSQEVSTIKRFTYLVSNPSDEMYFKHYALSYVCISIQESITKNDYEVIKIFPALKNESLSMLTDILKEKVFDVLHFMFSLDESTLARQVMKESMQEFSVLHRDLVSSIIESPDVTSKPALQSLQISLLYLDEIALFPTSSYLGKFYTQCLKAIRCSPPSRDLLIFTSTCFERADLGDTVSSVTEFFLNLVDDFPKFLEEQEIWNCFHQIITQNLKLAPEEAKNSFLDSIAELLLADKFCTDFRILQLYVELHPPPNHHQVMDMVIQYLWETLLNDDSAVYCDRAELIWKLHFFERPNLSRLEKLIISTFVEDRPKGFQRFVRLWSSQTTDGTLLLRVVSLVLDCLEESELMVRYVARNWISNNFDIILQPFLSVTMFGLIGDESNLSKSRHNRIYNSDIDINCISYSLYRLLSVIQMNKTKFLHLSTSYDIDVDILKSNLKCCILDHDVDGTEWYLWGYGDDRCCTNYLDLICVCMVRILVAFTPVPNERMNVTLQHTALQILELLLTAGISSSSEKDVHFNEMLELLMPSLLHSLPYLSFPVQESLYNLLLKLLPLTISKVKFKQDAPPLVCCEPGNSESNVQEYSNLVKESHLKSLSSQFTLHAQVLPILQILLERIIARQMDSSFKIPSLLSLPFDIYNILRPVNDENSILFGCEVYSLYADSLYHVINMELISQILSIITKFMLNVESIPLQMMRNSENASSWFSLMWPSSTTSESINNISDSFEVVQKSIPKLLMTFIKNRSRFAELSSEAILVLQRRFPRQFYLSLILLESRNINVGPVIRFLAHEKLNLSESIEILCNLSRIGKNRRKLITLEDDPHRIVPYDHQILGVAYRFYCEWARNPCYSKDALNGLSSLVSSMCQDDDNPLAHLWIICIVALLLQCSRSFVEQVPSKKFKSDIIHVTRTLTSSLTSISISQDSPTTLLPLPPCVEELLTESSDNSDQCANTPGGSITGKALNDILPASNEVKSLLSYQIQYQNYLEAVKGVPDSTALLQLVLAVVIQLLRQCHKLMEGNRPLVTFLMEVFNEEIGRGLTSVVFSNPIYNAGNTRNLSLRVLSLMVDTQSFSTRKTMLNQFMNSAGFGGTGNHLSLIHPQMAANNQSSLVGLNLSRGSFRAFLSILASGCGIQCSVVPGVIDSMVNFKSSRVFGINSTFELCRKAGEMRRLSLLIYATPPGFFDRKINFILERVIDGMRDVGVINVEAYLILRVLLFRGYSLGSIWPLILSDMNRILTTTSVLDNNLTLVLMVLKFIDLASLMELSTFQANLWVFVRDITSNKELTLNSHVPFVEQLSMPDSALEYISSSHGRPILRMNVLSSKIELAKACTMLNTFAIPRLLTSSQQPDLEEISRSLEEEFIAPDQWL